MTGPIKLVIENYQSIQRLELDIEGLTVLTGPSNRGKSATCRAYQASIFHQTGDDFIRVTADQARVFQEFDGHQLEWVRNRKQTTYRIDDRFFSKVGREFPSDEVAKLGFIELDVQGHLFRPQIQTQFAPPFLLSVGSPVVIAEVLSLSKTVQVVSKANRQAKTDVNQFQSQLKLRRQDESRYSSELSSLEAPEAVLQTQMAELERLELNCSDVQENCQVIQDLVADWKFLENLLISLEVLDTLQVPDLPETESTLGKIRELYLEYTQVTQAIQKLEQLPDLEFLEFLELACISTQLMKLIELNSECQSYRQSFQVLRKQEVTLSSELQVLQQEFKQLQQMGSCPWCGQVFDCQDFSEV